MRLQLRECGVARCSDLWLHTCALFRPPSSWERRAARVHKDNIKHKPRPHFAVYGNHAQHFGIIVPTPITRDFVGRK